MFQKKIVTKEDEEVSKMDVKEEVAKAQEEKKSKFTKWHEKYGKAGEAKEKSFKERTEEREPLKKNPRYDPDYMNPKEERRQRELRRLEEKQRRLGKKQEVETVKSKVREAKEKIREVRASHREQTIAARAERAGGKGAKVVGDIARFWKEHPGEIPKGRRRTPRTNRAKQFAKAQQSNQTYRPALSDPFDLNPKKDIDFFGQPREYNLVGENKKYDLGFGTEKKHDLGIGKKYDLGIGSKKELDLFGNGNGKKKKNDKFW